MLLSEIVECSRNVQRELLYLEFGIIPIAYLIKIRKQMFLHHILHQNEDSLLFRFFMAQLRNPTQGDWATSVIEDIDELELGLQLDDIKNMTKNSFRKIVKEKVEQKALEYLVNMKESHISENAKGKLLKYDTLEIQGYLRSSDLDISVNEKKVALQMQS